ncbi:MAG: ABC transporter permease [Burkholderiales bacterium]
MTEATAPSGNPAAGSHGSTRWRPRLGWVAAFAIAVVTVLLVVGVLGPWIAPYGATEASLAARLKPPAWLDGGSWAHPLGTDPVGRDILSRLIIGTRITLSVAVAALLVGTVVGTALGLVAGYFGGVLDKAIMRLTDVAIGFPIILVALLLAVASAPRAENVVISVSLILWSRFARVVRAEVLSLRERDYVALARVSGVSGMRIMLTHLLPNVTNTVIVLASLQIGFTILTEASLSFLGAGIPPPAPAWGAMVAEGRNYVVQAWWVPTMPGLAILVAVLAFNLLGDWLRDTLDPKLRQL